MYFRLVHIKEVQVFLFVIDFSRETHPKPTPQHIQIHCEELALWLRRPRSPMICTLETQESPGVIGPEPEGVRTGELMV